MIDVSCLGCNLREDASFVVVELFCCVNTARDRAIFINLTLHQAGSVEGVVVRCVIFLVVGNWITVILSIMIL